MVLKLQEVGSVLMFNTLLCGRMLELLRSRRSCRAIALRAAHPGPGKDSGKTFFIPKQGWDAHALAADASVEEEASCLIRAYASGQ